MKFYAVTAKALQKPTGRYVFIRAKKIEPVFTFSGRFFSKIYTIQHILHRHFYWAKKQNIPVGMFFLQNHVSIFHRGVSPLILWSTRLLFFVQVIDLCLVAGYRLVWFYHLFIDKLQRFGANA